MKLLIVGSLLFALVTPVTAAPRTPTVIAIEIEHDKFEHIGFGEQLPMAEEEPGGFLVPKNADPKWFALGLKPDDIIVTEDGRPVGEMLLISDGLTLLGVLRKGKPVILAITIHPEPHQTLEIDDDSMKRLQTMNPPFAIPVRNKHGNPTGMRVIDILIAAYVKIQVGDIVRSIDGNPIRTETELITKLRNLPIGQTTVVVDRGGRAVTLTLTRAAKTP
jgi:hypothetical protein